MSLANLTQVISPDRATAARAKTLARLVQGNGANKALLHKSGQHPGSTASSVVIDKHWVVTASSTMQSILCKSLCRAIISLCTYQNVSLVCHEPLHVALRKSCICCRSCEVHSKACAERVGVIFCSRRCSSPGCFHNRQKCIYPPSGCASSQWRPSFAHVGLHCMLSMSPCTLPCRWLQLYGFTSCCVLGRAPP